MIRLIAILSFAIVTDSYLKYDISNRYQKFNQLHLFSISSSTSFSDKIAQIIVSGLTSISNIISNTLSPSSTTALDKSKYYKNEFMNPDEVFNGIRNDFNNGYLFSGCIDTEIYHINCTFTDPTLSFKGLQTFVKNVASVKPLADLFLDETTVILYSLILKEEVQPSRFLHDMNSSIVSSANDLLYPSPSILSSSAIIHSKTATTRPTTTTIKTATIEAHWRMSGSVKLPWKPRIELPGKTVYTLSTIGSSNNNDISNSIDDDVKASLNNNKVDTGDSNIHNSNNANDNYYINDGRIIDYYETWGLPALNVLLQLFQTSPITISNNKIDIGSDRMNNIDGSSKVIRDIRTYIDSNNPRMNISAKKSNMNLQTTSKDHRNKTKPTVCIDLMNIKAIISTHVPMGHKSSNSNVGSTHSKSDNTINNTNHSNTINNNISNSNTNKSISNIISAKDSASVDIILQNIRKLQYVKELGMFPSWLKHDNNNNNNNNNNTNNSITNNIIISDNHCYDLSEWSFLYEIPIKLIYNTENAITASNYNNDDDNNTSNFENIHRNTKILYIDRDILVIQIDPSRFNHTKVYDIHNMTTSDDDDGDYNNDIIIDDLKSFISVYKRKTIGESI